MSYSNYPLLNDADFLKSCEEFVTIRQDIHANPELGGEVPRTAEIVANYLKQWGYETHTNIGGLGVVGVLKNGTSSKSIGIRADMDALPILEDTDLPYASKIEGRMHACGHDGHTAILLAAAQYIAKEKPFDGTVNLIFQPDEEGLCGAKEMIDDGLFTRFPCDAVYGLHNMPGQEVGHGVVKSGVGSANSDKVTIRLIGKGGHAAYPHLSNDVTVVLGNVILALQTIVSRNVDPTETAVVSIGTISAGKTYNVTPANAELVLSVRSFGQAGQDLLEKRIKEIVAGQCMAYGIEHEIIYDKLVPSIVNSNDETLLAREAVTQVLGEEFVAGDETPAFTGSEDFAWMLQERPGCYFLLANGEGEWHGCSVHNPGYDFNDKLISIGAACWIQVVKTCLPQI